jgi:hypothetical protein
MTSKIVSKLSSIASLVLMPCSPSKHNCGRGRGPGGGVVLVVDVVVLAAGSLLKRAMPISIQSNLPQLLFSLVPIWIAPTAINSCAALTTGNFHFFASVAKCFPHCVAKMYTPDDYAPIVLSGIVQSNEESVTTKLEVGFLFHLPYRTREGNTASLMVLTGPNISVNTIIGLLFMKATGMILDLVNKVMDCRYLDCPPFPVDFCWTSNHVPVMDKPSDTPANHAMSHLQIIKEVENIERYINAKVLAGGLTLTPKTLALHFGLKSPVCMVVDNDSSSAALHSTMDMSTQWVPPPGLPEGYDNYQAIVLGEDGLLCVTACRPLSLMLADTVSWLCGHQCVCSPSGNRALILVGEVLVVVPVVWQTVI